MDSMTGIPGPTRGSELLKDWRSRQRDMTQAEACAELNMDPAAYCALERGRRTPCLKRAVSIEAVAGVPPRAWLEKAKSKRAA